ncbi:putative integral membrane protein [Acanthocheilonema viteae]
MKKKILFEKSTNDSVSNDSMISLNTMVGCFTLLNSIKLIVIIGLLSTSAVSVFIIMYFRPAMLTTLIPVTVISTTLYGILRRNHFYLWPIIGISWFHVILTLYFDLFFMYFFIFKPNYIIMVLNWMFDTLNTKKTTSYFVQCTAIITSNKQRSIITNHFYYYRTRLNIENDNVFGSKAWHESCFENSTCISRGIMCWGLSIV